MTVLSFVFRNAARIHDSAGKAPRKTSYRWTHAWTCQRRCTAERGRTRSKGHKLEALRRGERRPDLRNREKNQRPGSQAIASQRQTHREWKNKDSVESKAKTLQCSAAGVFTVFSHPNSSRCLTYKMWCSANRRVLTLRELHNSGTEARDHVGQKVLLHWVGRQPCQDGQETQSYCFGLLRRTPATQDMHSCFKKRSDWDLTEAFCHPLFGGNIERHKRNKLSCKWN